MDSSQTRAVYELTALVAHIVGEAEEPDRPRKRRDRGEPEQAEGHIVAHIKAGHHYSYSCSQSVPVHPLLLSFTCLFRCTRQMCELFTASVIAFSALKSAMSAELTDGLGCKGTYRAYCFSACYKCLLQVPGCYLKAGRGYQPDSAHVGSPGQSPLSFSNTRKQLPGPFRASPLQPSDARPSPEKTLAAANVSAVAAHAPENSSEDSAAHEQSEGASIASAHALDAADHVSTDGVQQSEALAVSTLSLKDSSGAANASEAQDFQVQRRGSDGQGDDSAGHAEGLAACSPGREQGKADAAGTTTRSEAADVVEADQAASSPPVEPELVAERAEHAAAAVAAEGLELDRSSEPAALAAARSGSLVPGAPPRCSLSLTCIQCICVNMSMMSHD